MKPLFIWKFGLNWVVKGTDVAVVPVEPRKPPDGLPKRPRFPKLKLEEPILVRLVVPVLALNAAAASSS